MSLEISLTNKKTGAGICMLLYGPSNAGKTHAGGTLPEGRVLFIDFERSTTTLKNKKHHVVHVDALEYSKEKEPFTKFLTDMMTLIEKIKNKSKYEYIVIDTLTEFESIAVSLLSDEKGFDFPRLKEYGEGAVITRKIIRIFRSLCGHGIHVVFLANERIIEKTRSERIISSVIAPEFTQNLALSCSKYFDIVGRVRYNPKTGNRGIQFNGSDRTFVARTRIPLDAFESTDLNVLFQKVSKGE